MTKFLGYDSFWDFATERSQQSNDLSHHKCCDSWTTRQAKKVRASHTQEIKWRHLLSNLKCPPEDQKAHLQAKMIEECWRLPVVLNKSCISQQHKHLEQNLPFRFHNSGLLPSTFQASYTEQDFVYQNHNSINMFTTLGIYKFI